MISHDLAIIIVIIIINIIIIQLLGPLC